MSFEENLNKLNEIVTQLEKGDATLEKSVELYGEGVKLAAVCKEQLSKAELTVSGES